MVTTCYDIWCKKNDQDPCKLSYDTGLENKLFLREECEGVLLTLPAKTKLLWWTLWVSVENKAFVRSIAADQEPGDVFIHGNKATLLLYSSYSWSHHLVKPAAVSFLLQDPSIFYKFSGVKWRCGKSHQPCIFQIIIPPGIWYCWGSLFSWEASQWFPWPFQS